MQISHLHQSQSHFPFRAATQHNLKTTIVSGHENNLNQEDNNLNSIAAFKWVTGYTESFGLFEELGDLFWGVCSRLRCRHLHWADVRTLQKWYPHKASHDSRRNLYGTELRRSPQPWKTDVTFTNLLPSLNDQSKWFIRTKIAMCFWLCCVTTVCIANTVKYKNIIPFLEHVSGNTNAASIERCCNGYTMLEKKDLNEAPSRRLETQILHRHRVFFFLPKERITSQINQWHCMPVCVKRLCTQWMYNRKKGAAI